MVHVWMHAVTCASKTIIKCMCLLYSVQKTGWCLWACVGEAAQSAAHTLKIRETLLVLTMKERTNVLKWNYIYRVMLTMPNDTSEIGLLDILKAVCVSERSREKNSCIIQVLSIYKTDVFYPMSERGLSKTSLIHYLRCHLVNLTTQFQSVRDQISSVNETINLINHSNFLLPHLCFPSSNTILHVEVVRLIKTGLLLRKHRYKWLQTKPHYILYKSHNKYASTAVCTLLLLEMCWVNFVFFIADCSLRCCLTEQHYTKRCFFNTLTDIQKGTKL